MGRFDLRIAAKLALAAVAPLIVLIGLAGHDLADRWSTRVQMAELGRLTEGVAGFSRLIHELQRERGASNVFVTSKGAQMGAEVAAQRKLTDEQRRTATGIMTQLRATAVSDQLRNVLAEAEAAVTALDRRRAEVDALSITAADSLAYFTQTITRLFAVTSEIGKVSIRGDVTTMTSAYIDVAHGKESAGLERATGAGGLAAGRFDIAAYRRVLSLAAAQETYFAMFEAAASPSQREFFRKTLSSPASDDVARMREIVAKGGLSGEMTGIDAKSWFDATTARINLLKTVEDRLAADLATLTAAVHAEATNALILLAGAIALALALCVGVVTLISRSITRPIRQLVGSMKELASGNFDVVLPGLGRKDEVGEVAGAVELFKVRAIEKARLEAGQEEAQARAAAAERKALMHQLADSFETTVGRIVETVTSSATELEGAAAILTKTADTTQQLAGIVASASEEASANFQSVASATEELVASVGEIGRQVHDSNSIAVEAVSQAQKTDARVAELAEAASRIGNVIKLITAVADQTNLLALNATIEAARAGEAGRGFAVVAQEVKALAAQTSKATDEIGSQIAGMQTATGESVSAIREIGTTIGRISEIASTIAAAVEEQGAATQEISRNVHQAAEGTSQVAAKIVDVDRAAGETGSVSSQVLVSAKALSSEGNHLKVEVEKFLAMVRAA